MATNALVFSDLPASDTDLIFGASGEVPRRDIVITGAFPALTATLFMIPPVETVISGQFAGLTMVMQADYTTQTQRPVVAHIATSAQVAVPSERGVTQPEQHGLPTDTGVSAPWVDALVLQAALSVKYESAQSATRGMFTSFDDGVPVRATTCASMQEGDAQWLRFFSQFQEADRMAAARLTGQFEDGLRDRRISRTASWQDARHREPLRYQGQAKPGVPVNRYMGGRFQNARVPPAGETQWPKPPVLPPAYWGTALLFQCPPVGYPALVFGVQPCYAVTPSAPFQILPARFYMTTHSIYAQRLPDLADIPIFAATVSADSGSYCWSLSASGPASLFALLAPVDGLPAQLRLTLDGMPWVFAIDTISRSAQFAQTGCTIQGRSVTALIAAPYVRSESRIESDDKTAQQLAVINLAGTGIDLDWGVGAGALANSGMIDWFVPAGAYSRQGTALESVSRIVQAAGGYLQSHRDLPSLLARHPYGMRSGDASGAPWDWMTGAADIELAPDAVITESVQRQDGPDINAVYVSGTTHGVLALVKRSGTAADKLASMVTDSLITHADAARQAGLAILGAAGHKYAVTLDLPVLTGAGQPGVIDVGQLVQVNAATPWRGRVRGVSVSAKQPSLRQTITLERHIA